MSFPVPVKYKLTATLDNIVIEYSDGQEWEGLPSPPEGGGEPTGTKEITITENGVYTEDVAEYADAEITVNVSGGVSGYTANEIANGTAPSGAVVVDLGDNDMLQWAFAGRSLITSVNLSCANLGISAMENCTGLTTAVIKKTGSSRSGSAF